MQEKTMNNSDDHVPVLMGDGKAYFAHFNKLTPAENERLAILAEECAEVIQCVTKIMRHGYSSFHPANVDAGNNREQLEKELGHLDNILDMMVEEKDINHNSVIKHREKKSETIGRYLHHQ